MRRRVMLALMAVLVLAACGGDGGQAISDPSEQGAGSGDDGSAGDRLDPPENITIPLPNGGTLTASISDPANRYAYVSAEYSLDEFDEIVAFYTDWAETDPRDWSGRDSSFESQGTTVRAALWDGPASRISVVECAGDSDAVCVEISDNDA